MSDRYIRAARSLCFAAFIAIAGGILLGAAYLHAAG